MTVHGSLKDRKFHNKGRKKKKKSHSGQEHASARKQGLVEPGSLSKGFNIETDETEKPMKLRKFS